MKKLSTYSSSHTPHFPKVPQKLQKCQSIIISPSDTSEKIQACEPARPPPCERRGCRASAVPAPCQPRSLAGGVGGFGRGSNLRASSGTSSSGGDRISSDRRGPQGCGGCRAHRPGICSWGHPQEWPCDRLEEGDSSPPCSSFPCVPGGPRGWAWQPRLASRQSYGQELARLDNLGKPVLCLTCSCKRSS